MTASRPHGYATPSFSARRRHSTNDTSENIPRGLRRSTPVVDRCGPTPLTVTPVTVHPQPRPQQITVLVADDNPVVRAVLRDLLGNGGQISVVGEAANGVEALELAAAARPDVTLLDHRMPLRDGLSVVVALTGHTRVLMLTRTAEEEVVLQAVRAGRSVTSYTGSSRPPSWSPPSARSPTARRTCPPRRRGCSSTNSALIGSNALIDRIQSFRFFSTVFGQGWTSASTSMAG